MKKYLKIFSVMMALVFGMTMLVACKSKKETWSDWQVTDAPCCTTGGEESRTSNKGNIETRELSVDENAHDWSCWLIMNVPGCDYDGLLIRVCVGCETYQFMTISAFGHDWTEWELVIEPNCEEEGEYQRNCLNCDEVENDVIDANGHNYEHNHVGATCTEGGYDEYICLDCEHNYIENEVEALGHDWTEYVVTIVPDCYNEGLMERECLTCGETSSRVIPVLEHEYAHNHVEAGCEEGGYDEYTCTECGDSYTENEVEALGHDWGNWTTVTYPGWDTDGLRQRVCANDGEIQTRIIPSLKKKFEGWIEDLIA